MCDLDISMGIFIFIFNGVHMRYEYHDQCHCRRCKIMRRFYDDMVFFFKFLCVFIVAIGVHYAFV